MAEGEGNPAALEVVEFGAMLPGLRAELEGDEPDPFDSEGVPLHFRAKDRHVALRDADGRLVASTGMLVVHVDVGAQRISVVGFGGVIVSARHRGRGLGRQVVQAALARARTMGPPFALLFCHPSREGFYRRLAFTPITTEVSVHQPEGAARMPLTTMWHPLVPGARWPAGPVNVVGLPF